ncbi:MAG TPA: hypothetical protein EYN91_12310 [Candidatus Melainabacteria bacterium]|nr:hypothetical protein [Candidatus Melainabacteria bacterium]HIN63696.1 hypothetical protein [Candidatus Obscuribacterales bacterium]
MSFYDLRTCSYDEFLNFVFDHPVEKEPWYRGSKVEVVFDAIHNTALLTELFSNARPLLEKYTREQLDQGFWALQSGLIDGLLPHTMFDHSVPFEKRAECIRAMFFLYRDLFAVDDLGTSSNMWWDCISSSNQVGWRSQSVLDDNMKIQDVMFETLSKILYLESEECQGAALHGLGHLRHPNTETVIRDWIATQPDLPEDDLEFAEACITGDIM